MASGKAARAVPRVAPIALLAILALACSEQSPPPQPPEASPEPGLLAVHPLVGRPAADSATLNVVAAEQPVELELRLRPPGDVELTTTLAAKAALDVPLTHLEPGTEYHYELTARAASQSETFTGRFVTRRAPGSTFTFALVSDPHLPVPPPEWLDPAAAELFLPEIYDFLGARHDVGAVIRQTLARIRQHRVDFIVCLGDMLHLYRGFNDPFPTAAAADHAYLDLRRHLGRATAEAAFFAVIGNWEGENGWHPERLRRHAREARMKYLLNPGPATYPESGSSNEDYFAWTWGDALLVVANVMSYTPTTHTLSPDDDGTATDWTLGAEQLSWLEATLAGSTARFKLLFIHHPVGGKGGDELNSGYGRGGGRAAHVGEQEVLHRLMLEHGAQILFYGHDHVFTDSVVDGIHYTLPEAPARRGSSAAPKPATTTTTNAPASRSSTSAPSGWRSSSSTSREESSARTRSQRLQSSPSLRSSPGGLPCTTAGRKSQDPSSAVPEASPTSSSTPAASPAAGFELPTEVAGIDLDPRRAAENKAERLYSLNTVTIPALRFLGFAALSVAVFLYLRFFVQAPEAQRIALLYAGGALTYCLVVAVALRAFYRRWAGERLAVTFLALDVVVQIIAIYLTGGDESWLAAVLLLRMADQATSGQRRALFFTHWNVLCFLALIAYLAGVEGRDVDWPWELTKAALLYAAGWWITVSARGGDRRRRQVSAAIGATRQMILQLEAQARRLDEAKVHAEAANEAKSQFLANMSHELRTPLNAVIGIADLLAADELSSQQHEFVILLQTSADSLLRLVDDILDFSRIEAGQLSLEEESCHLPTVVEEVLRLLAQRAEAQGIELRFTSPVNLPPVTTDRGRLRQVLLNLVGNAVKFTPRGWVEVRLLALEHERESSGVRIEVVDSGIGIEEAQQQRLFDPFTQADGTSSRRYGGTGLGLAIVRRLVDLLGGEVGLTSQPGAGSTFWVELPLRPAR